MYMKGQIMTTITATEARKSFFKIIKDTRKFHEPVRITSPSGTTVMISEDDYDSMVETMHLLEEPGFKESLALSEKEYASGKTKSFEEVFGEPL